RKTGTQGTVPTAQTGSGVLGRDWSVGLYRQGSYSSVPFDWQQLPCRILPTGLLTAHTGAWVVRARRPTRRFVPDCRATGPQAGASATGPVEIVALLLLLVGIVPAELGFRTVGLGFLAAAVAVLLIGLAVQHLIKSFRRNRLASS